MDRITSISTENKYGLSYEVFFPKDYFEKERELPLLVFLHGAGERGYDIEDVNTNALPMLYIQTRAYAPLWQGRKQSYLITDFLTEFSYWTGKDGLF